jgi:hypothetical protein
MRRRIFRTRASSARSSSCDSRRSTRSKPKVTLHHTGWGEGDEWDKTYAYFDRAWATVLGNLKKRFETGPYDWTEWMKQLRQMQEKAGQK